MSRYQETAERAEHIARVLETGRMLSEAHDVREMAAEVDRLTRERDAALARQRQADTHVQRVKQWRTEADQRAVAAQAEAGRCQEGWRDADVEFDHFLDDLCPDEWDDDLSPETILAHVRELRVRVVRLSTERDRLADALQGCVAKLDEFPVAWHSENARAAARAVLAEIGAE